MHFLLYAGWLYCVGRNSDLVRVFIWRFRLKETCMAIKLTRVVLQWLILCVHLSGLRDAERAGKTLLLGMSMKVLRSAFGSVDE